MNVKHYAAMLLFGRIISVVLISMVIRIQYRLLKENNPTSVQSIRRVLFSLAIVVLVSSFVPILIDTVTLFGELPRSNPAPIGIAYAFSNCISAIIASYLLWYLYKISAKEKLATDSTARILKNKNAKLRKSLKR